MSARADIWRQIRAHPGCQSIAALAGDAGASMRSTRAYVEVLVRAGVLEICERRADHTNRYRMVRDPGPTPPRHDGQQLITRPTERYRVWQSIRVLRQFSHSDLVATAECGEKAARQLCADLRTAGYVRLTQSAYGGARRREARYQLLRDTGPLPLVRHRGGALTDPNTQEEFE